MSSTFHKCRLCLKLGDFCSIFEQDESIKLSDMVMAFTSIQIYEGDGLSERVCTSCIENLSTAYLFKQQCERIDSMLRKAPDTNINNPAVADYKDLFYQELHVHRDCNEDFIEGEITQNAMNDVKSEPIYAVANKHPHEISDDTDSDMDSVKCVCCNQSYSTMGPHTCLVQCTIEHNHLQRSSSNETLVASDLSPIRRPEPINRPQPPVPERPAIVSVTCVLCDEKYDQYNDYVTHLNKCTTNVKLHHFVCPVCHEMHSNKPTFLEHLKDLHFPMQSSDSEGQDCVDFAPTFDHPKKMKSVRRQIGWSIEDIYQEIDCKKPEELNVNLKDSPASSVFFDKQTPTSSPLKKFFSKFGNETFSRQSTPKRVSFRKLIENGKAKTAVYLPFMQGYKKKKTNGYSPISNNKMQITTKVRASLPAELVSDSDYNSPSGTSEESWRLKQNLICACDKKVFMLSESVKDRDRLSAMINELGGVVAENTKMEMMASHFISVLPNDTFTGMMVCALATGKWVLNVNYVYDSFRCKKFLQEYLYEWLKQPGILEVDHTTVEVAKAAVYWHLELQAPNAKYPFEGKQVVLIMKKKYRQYYQMIFKTLKAKPVTYDPRTPGSCCTADYCFVDMKVIERVKLRFFARHNVPVFPYQYILVHLLKRGKVDNEHKYLLQDCKMYAMDNNYLLNNTC